MNGNQTNIHLSTDSSHKLASLPEKTNGLFEKAVRLAIVLWAMGIVTLVAATQPVVVGAVILALRPLLEYCFPH